MCDSHQFALTSVANNHIINPKNRVRGEKAYADHRHESNRPLSAFLSGGFFGKPVGIFQCRFFRKTRPRQRFESVQRGKLFEKRGTSNPCGVTLAILCWCLQRSYRHPRVFRRRGPLLPASSSISKLSIAQSYGFLPTGNNKLQEELSFTEADRNAKS